MTQENANQEYQYMIRRIGSTTYKVKVVFASGGETLEEKILRMIRNEGSAAAHPCGIINTETAGNPDFSGLPAFFVTNLLLVQCSI